ncbi:hypothetical protein IMG5_129210 [Ichthyophthirius multifiliis]|uniref:phosphoinositide 5-phosphatase n=1 Tax=Ichthyophthirius multifiliis TaxID=5932 RepID=G0QW41_ICHMU|nr:hypothetical protein IMG5_129210 [Ichthyophthirius multifiliis]EGR30561.1 hypothetical protein IMG5_129210 [Ichthyophthirius multifiliis]|eukprot:XP_004032148.1 hypothetical protein IMG5_129210 [Ichthyophthirius multifiliis]
MQKIINIFSKNSGLQSQKFTQEKLEQPITSIKAIELAETPDYFYLKAEYSLTNITQSLQIHKQSGKIQQLNPQQIPSNIPFNQQYSAFLGIINIYGQNFLVLVKNVNLIPFLNENFSILEINQCEFRAFFPLQVSINILKQQQSIENTLSKGGYYFCYKFPLTVSQQKFYIDKMNTDNDYLWNLNLLKPLIQQKIAIEWHIQLIQGYVSSVKGYPLYYLLISRRQMRRGGTRYNHRGVNSDGYVANFVESEQILSYGADILISHVQIRGSVPVFWSQQGLQAKLYLNQSQQMSHNSFNMHFDYIKKHYGDVTCVNLMTYSIPNEQLLSKEYVYHVNNIENIEYLEFDLKLECKGDKFDKIDLFLNKKIISNLKNFSFFSKKGNQILQKQKGIVRSNCLDCLDRTNFFQQKLGLQTLFQLIFPYLQGFQITTNDVLFKQLQYGWGENGDLISKHYAGTKATTSKVAKTGKQGLVGYIKGKCSSAKRFVNANLKDSKKQEIYCIILGENYESQANLQYEYEILEQIKNRQNEFLEEKNLNVFICTWNVNCFEPYHTKFDFQKIFCKNNQKSELVIFCMQELVEANAKNIMVSTIEKSNTITNWIESLLYNLGPQDYFLVGQYSMVGIQTLIFAQKNIKNNLSDIEFDYVKCSFTKTKGSVIVRFRLFDTSLCILNCHLQHGGEKTIQNLVNIHDQAFQQERMSTYKKQPVWKSDKIFLVGDLNFRLNNEIKYEDVLQEISTINQCQNKKQQKLLYDKLLQYDQLNFFKNSNQFQILQKYKEGQILFLPTYKLNVNTDVYDISKKQSVPCWCDRILYCDMENEQNNNSYISEDFKLYESVNVNHSDHKPVVALIQVKVKIIDEEKREKILNQIIQIQEINQIDEINNIGNMETQNDNNPKKDFNMFENFNVQQQQDENIKYFYNLQQNVEFQNNQNQQQNSQDQQQNNNQVDLLDFSNNQQIQNQQIQNVDLLDL